MVLNTWKPGKPSKDPKENPEKNFKPCPGNEIVISTSAEMPYVLNNLKNCL